MTKEELEQHLRVYTDEIQRLISAENHWALVHLVVILPDICGALESATGEATKARYVNWANQYVANSLLNGEEWYEIRCHLLHQGRTHGQGRYERYRFGVAQGNMTVHGNVLNGKIIELDPTQVWKTLQSGLDQWYRDISNQDDPIKSGNVEKNVSSLDSGPPSELRSRTIPGNWIISYLPVRIRLDGEPAWQSIF